MHRVRHAAAADPSPFHLLADVVFKDSLLFPFALSLIGIAVIAAGLFYHRKQEAIATWLAAHLPEAVLRLRPGRAR